MLYLLAVLICSLVYFGVKVSSLGDRERETGEGHTKAEEGAYPGQQGGVSQGAKVLHTLTLYFWCFALPTSTASAPPRERFVKVK
jgi:hypothetical protein